MKKTKGKFVVFEGIDGSGKATQVKMLGVWLKKQKIPFKVVDFPQYETSFYGALVGRYLKGEFGEIDQVSPYLASLAYAGDRLEAKSKIEKWLGKGELVVANRYLGSNLAHQSAKLPLRKRKLFIRWLKKLEYEIHRIPKEDLVIFFYVPAKISQKLVEKKGERHYVGGKKKDIHEKDLDFLEKSAEQYLFLAKNEPHWITIRCVSDGRIMLPEKIHQKVVEVLKKRGII